MRKTIILPTVLILLVLVFAGQSWSVDTPVWWPSALAEAQKDGYTLTTPEEIQSQYTSSTNTIILDVRPDYEFKAGHHLDHQCRFGAVRDSTGCIRDVDCPAVQRPIPLDLDQSRFSVGVGILHRFVGNRNHS